MIRYNTSNDRICKAVISWCKENRYLYSFDTDDRDRNLYVYPFTIAAPSSKETELIDMVRKVDNQVNKKLL